MLIKDEITGLRPLAIVAVSTLDTQQAWHYGFVVFEHSHHGAGRLSCPASLVNYINTYDSLIDS